jgi:hypothetical protein
MPHACSVTSGPICNGTPDDNSYYGNGIVDALAAVQ